MESKTAVVKSLTEDTETTKENPFYTDTSESDGGFFEWIRQVGKVKSPHRFSMGTNIGGKGRWTAPNEL